MSFTIEWREIDEQKFNCATELFASPKRPFNILCTLATGGGWAVIMSLNNIEGNSKILRPNGTKRRVASGPPLTNRN